MTLRNNQMPGRKQEIDRRTDNYYKSNSSIWAADRRETLREREGTKRELFILGFFRLG